VRSAYPASRNWAPALLRLVWRSRVSFLRHEARAFALKLAESAVVEAIDGPAQCLLDCCYSQAKDFTMTMIMQSRGNARAEDAA